MKYYSGWARPGSKTCFIGVALSADRKVVTLSDGIPERRFSMFSAAKPIHNFDFVLRRNAVEIFYDFEAIGKSFVHTVPVDDIGIRGRNIQPLPEW